MTAKTQQDIDRQFLIEELTNDVAHMLVEDYGMSIPQALEKIYNSRTYEKLEDANTGLYYQGGVYIFDMLREELEL